MHTRVRKFSPFDARKFEILQILLQPMLVGVKIEFCWTFEFSVGEDYSPSALAREPPFVYRSSFSNV